MLNNLPVYIHKYTNVFYALMNVKRLATNKLGTSPEFFLEKEFTQRQDPWGYEKSEYERQRFEKLLLLVQSVPHKRVLEIGCAEGHFTQMLGTICQDITALDLSRTALSRAKPRVPKATFIHTTISEMQNFTKPFDLIICSEILCYVDKKQEAIDKMAQNTKYNLTSNAGLLALAIDPYFSKLKLVKKMYHMNLSEKKMTKIALWKVK